MQNVTIPASVTLRRRGGRAIPVEDDGLIRNVRYQDEVRLLVQTHPSVACITVDARKEIHEVDSISTNAGPMFSRYITLPAKYEDNHVRLVEVSETGQLKVVEIALVQQGRNFFLTKQLVYNEQCYRDSHGHATVPSFTAPFVQKPWPDMVQLVNNLAPNRLEFPSMLQFRGSKDQPKPPVQQNHAVVLWYNLAKRQGMALTGTENQAIIMAQHVPQNGTRLRYLNAGDTVRFDRMVEQETGCPFRLEGITLKR